MDFDDASAASLRPTDRMIDGIVCACCNINLNNSFDQHVHVTVFDQRKEREMRLIKVVGKQDETPSVRS